jgi:hypothetical protein
MLHVYTHRIKKRIINKHKKITKETSGGTTCIGMII